MVIIRALVTFALLWGVTCQAGWYSGDQLIEFMRSWERADREAEPREVDLIHGSRFMGYVTGVHDVLSGTEYVCVPGGATNSTIAAVAAKYINANPAEWPKPAHTLIITALARAFPCERGRD